MTAPGLLLLLGAIALCAALDLQTHNIPHEVTVPVGLIAILGGAFGWWPFSWPAALVALAAFALAGLPGGDCKAILTVGGLLGLRPMLVLLGLVLVITMAIFATLGRRRSLIGVPFFPLVAAVAVAILAGPWLLETLSVPMEGG